MTATENPESARRAVLISSGGFQSGSGLESYPSITASADALHDILSSSELWDTESCQRVKDPPDSAVLMKAVVAQAARCAPADTLLVYFVGHAHHPRRIDSAAGIHLAHGGSRRDELWTQLPLYHVYDVVRDSLALTKILVLDCCHSGYAPALGSRTKPPEDALGGRSYVLKSLRQDDPDQNAAAFQHPGAEFTAFSGALIDVLRTGIPRKHNPLTVDDVFAEARSRLRHRHPVPEPLKRGDGEAILLENRSPEALDDVGRPDPVVVASPAELAEYWIGPDSGNGRRREAIEQFVAALGSSEQILEFADRIHRDGTAEQLEDFINVLLIGKPRHTGDAARVMVNAPCGACQRLGWHIEGRAAEYSGQAHREFTIAFTRPG